MHEMHHIDFIIDIRCKPVSPFIANGGKKMEEKKRCTSSLPVCLVLEGSSSQLSAFFSPLTTKQAKDEVQIYAQHFSQNYSKHMPITIHFIAQNTFIIPQVLSNYRPQKAINPSAKAVKAKPKHRNLLGVIQSLDISQIKHCYYNCNKRKK